MMKKLFTLLTLALCAVGAAWAEDVTLFTTDFSSSEWSSYTKESPITAKTTVNGIYFNCADYVANNALYFNGGGNIGPSRFCAIHVTGVNKSIKIVIENNNAKARVKYLIKEETSISSPSTSVDPGQGTTTTINYNMEGDGDELTFYFYQQGSSAPNIVNSILITTPDASTVTTVELTEVTVNGTPIDNLAELLSAGSLVFSEAYKGIPIVKYNVRTTITSGSSDPVVNNDLITAALTKDGESYKTTLTAGKNSYTLTFTDVDPEDVLEISEETIVVLSKDNISSKNYLAVSTNNWNEGKTYGAYTGDFYNLSSTDRNITIKVKGAAAFEVYVQNTNTGRGYKIQVGDNEPETISHGAKGLESSGEIACPTEQTTITIAGTGSSVYPVYVVFKSATAPITITSAGWATFSSASEVEIPAGVTAYYAQKKDETTVTLKEITGGYIPANTGVVVAGAADTYNAAKTTTGATLAETNLLKPWLTAGTPDDAEYYTLAVNGTAPVFKMSTGGTLAAGKAYLVLPAGARELGVQLGDDDVTGIAGLTTSQQGAVYYNLQGQRVSQPRKGLYIVNGQKVIMK